MTIRRSVDLSFFNERYMDFETAVDACPEGRYSLGRNLKFEIGEACDDLLRAMDRIGAPICNCDGIREIEILMFERIRANNSTGEVTSAGFEIQELINIGWRMRAEDLSFYQAETAEKLANA